MNKLVLMSWSDSNMAGDDWTWFITLTLRKNGTCSVGAMQTSSVGPTYRLPSKYPLRGGLQVKKAIEQLFSDDPLTSEEIDWQKILSVLLNHVPTLAKDIECVLAKDNKNQIDELEEVQLSFSQRPKLDAINEWWDKTKWTLSTLSHHIGNGMDNAKRRNLVYEFAQIYISKHGRYPNGKHVLSHNLTVHFPDYQPEDRKL